MPTALNTLIMTIKFYFKKFHILIDFSTYALQEQKNWAYRKVFTHPMKRNLNFLCDCITTTVNNGVTMQFLSEADSIYGSLLRRLEVRSYQLMIKVSFIFLQLVF